MSFVIKATIRHRDCTWVKSQGRLYRLGPRVEATVFVNQEEARRALDEMPEIFSNFGVEFSIEPADIEPDCRGD